MNGNIRINSLVRVGLEPTTFWWITVTLSIRLTGCVDRQDIWRLKRWQLYTFVEITFTTTCCFPIIFRLNPANGYRNYCEKVMMLHPILTFSDKIDLQPIFDERC